MTMFSDNTLANSRWNVFCLPVLAVILFFTASVGSAQNLLLNVSEISNSVPQWTKPADDDFTITVEGTTAKVGYWFLTSNNWFTVSPTDGTSTGEFNTITVAYNTENLDIGNYQGDIMVVAPNTTNSPQTIPVYITITPNAGVTTGVRINSATNGVPGRTVSIPVELVSVGDVNAVGASLNYDRRIFRNPEIVLGSGVSTNCVLVSNTSQASGGRVGFVVSRPDQTSTFGAGAIELVLINMSIVASANPVNYELTFSDTPVVNQVSDVNAAAMAAEWPVCSMRAVGGLEADVVPRATNDFAVTVADWTQVGRFVAGLDRLTSPAEFQRTDCAPLETYGDGLLSIIDWVQAGRYAAGLDGTPPAANGPYAVSTRGAAVTTVGKAIIQRPRHVWADAPLILEKGEVFDMDVFLGAFGNENALGFSLSFDPGLLDFIDSGLGEGAASSYLFDNRMMSDSGLVGVAMALPSAGVFDAGTQKMAKVRFQAKAVSEVSMVEISFADNPVRCELSSSRADILPSSFKDSVLFIAPRDTVYPYVKITGPDDGAVYETSANTVSIRGFIIDARSAIGEMAWSNNRGGGGEISPATQWQINGIELQPGENVITVTASNESGSDSADSITVIYSPSIGNVLHDYDGDGMADFAVYDEATGTWYIRKLDGSVIEWAIGWGGPGMEIVAGDYDGDGVSDLAVYSEAMGAWYIRKLSGEVLAWNEPWGGPGFAPVAGDFDGDGKSDFAVFHEQTGTWYIRKLSGEVLVWNESWGGPGFTPVAGDYDGSGSSDIAVYYQENGAWFIRSLDGTLIEWGAVWGGPGFVPVAGDYDGDGIDDMSVFHEVTGTWYIRSLAGDMILWAANWGGPGFVPVSGDCDGDGRADMVVYEQSTGMWFAGSINGNVLAWGEVWGGPGLVPAN